MPRYIVCGAGAIGSILGAQLYRTGHDVCLIGRAAHARAIQRGGLQLVTPTQRRSIKINAVDRVDRLKARPADCLLVTAKSQDTETVTTQLARCYGASTPVFSFQNAVANEGLLSRHFQRVYGALVEFSGNFLTPGVVEWTRNNYVALGRFPDGFDETVEEVSCHLESAGFLVERTHRIMAMKWWKLVLNTNNALLAVLGYWLQKGWNDPQVSSLTADLFDEDLRVLRAAGIPLQAPSGQPDIETMIEQLRQGSFGLGPELSPRARTYPSTWQDLHLQRRRTEVDYLNGEIERLGTRFGLPTPLNSLLLELTKRMAENGEKPGKYTPHQLRAMISQDQGQ
ncbi:MAG: 2-dehydropantoate 2-reductase [Acidobacteriota bacterium]